MKRLISLIAVMSIVFLPVTPVFGATRTFTNAIGDNDWSTVGNWDVFPATTDDVVITNGGIYAISAGGSAEANAAQFSSSSFYGSLTLTLGGGTGVAIFSGVDGASGVNYGTINGNVSFGDYTLNAGGSTINGTATFYGSAFNGMGATINGSVVFNLTDPTAGDQTGTINAGAAGTVTGNFRTDSGITFQSGTVSSNINGSGGVTKDGDDTVTLSGTNTYTGATTINAGTLKLGNAGVIADSSAMVVDGTLDMNGHDETVGSLAGSGTVTNSAVGDVTLTAGDDNTSTTFSGVIEDGVGGGTTSLTKTGTGTLTLSGANTYTGDTTVTGGGLISTGSATFNGGTINTTRGSNVDAGDFSVTTSGAINVSGAITTSGGIEGDSAGADGGAVVLDSGATLEVGNITTTGGTADLGNTGGSGGAVTIHTVSTAIAGAITTSGGRSGFGGTGGNGGDGGAVDIDSGATLEVGNITTSGGDSDGGFDWGFCGNGGDVSINSVSTATVDAITTLGGSSVGLVGCDDGGNGGDVTVESGTVTVTGDINTSGGTGNVTTGVAGKIILSGGTLNFASLTGGGDVNFGGGILQYGAGNTQDLSAQIKDSSSAIKIDTNGNNLTYASAIASSNAGGLTKSGTGTLTLYGANAYTGGTVIKAGTIELYLNTTQLGVGSVTLGDSSGGSNDATLRVINDGITFSNAVVLASGTTGALTIETFDNLASTSFTGGVTGSNDLVLNAMSGMIFTTAAIDNAGTITNSGADDDSVLIRGGVGSNVTEIDQNSTTSALTIDTTSLTVNASGTTLRNTAGGQALTVSSSVVGTGNLILNNDSATDAGITLGAINNVGMVTNSGSGTGTVAVTGVIGANVTGVTQDSATSTLVLSGANIYTGATNVNTGTLTVNGSIASSSLTTVASGATIAGSGTTGALTINGTLSPGSSPGTLSTVGTATYAGGGTYTWEINKADGSQGTNWDHHDITSGSLAITATSGSPFTIDITGLTLGNVSGAVDSFNKYSNYTWIIASSDTSITGFAANAFALSTANFTNNNSITGTASNGSFGISVSGTDLQLTYTAAVNTPPNPIYWKGDTSAAWNYHTVGGVTNWVDGSGVEANAIPGATSDVHFSYTGAGNLATTLGQNFTINTLTMDAGSSAVSISGNTLTLNGSDAITIATTGGALTINSSVVLGGAQTWLNNSTTNDLTVAGNVTNGGYTLTVSGAGDTLISGIISGTGGITKTGTGTLELNGGNGYTGATAINVGTVKLGHATGLGTTDSGTSVTSGAALDLNGQAVVGEAVTINGTGISGGGALLNSSASVASLSGMVTLGSASTITSSGAGGLTLTGGVTNGGFDVTFDGSNATTVSTTKITGSGGLVKNGSGTLTLSAANDYTGATTINQGTVNFNQSLTASALNFSGDGTAVFASGTNVTNAITNDFQNQGTVQFSDGAHTVSGDIGSTGTGVKLVQVGTFDTHFNGDVKATSFAFTGNGGYVDVAAGKSITLQDAALTVNTNGASTITYLGSTAVTNDLGTSSMRFAYVNFNGGTVSLGANVYTDPTSQGGLGKTTIDNATVTLTGDRTVGGALKLQNGGAVDVGANTLTTDSYTQSSGTALNLTANSSALGDYGNIAAGGDVTITGGTINVTVGGYLANGATLDIITSGGTLAYAGATLTPYEHYTFASAVSGGVLTLTANRAENGFASDAGGNSNSAAVGAVLDNIPGASGDMLNVLNTLDGMSATEVAKSLQTMMPDSSSGTMQATRSLNGHFLTAINNRLAYARSGFGPGSGVSSGDGIDGMGFWTQGVGGYQKQNARDGIQGFSANTFGTMVGFDRVLDRHFRMGAAGGYGFGSVNSKTPGSPSTGINSFQGTVYGSYDSVDLCEARSQRKYSREAVRNQRERLWYVDGMMSFTQNNYDSRREIWIGSDKRIAKADHYGQQYGTQFETGYTFLTEKTRNLEMTPFTSLGYNYLRMNKYKEKGADAMDLKVDGDGFNQLEQGLGLKLAYPLFSEKAGTFIPSIKGAWLYDYIADRFETRSSFAGGGASFDTVGAKPAKSGMLFGAELAFLNKGNMTVTGNWDIEIKDEFLSNTYYGTVRYDF